MRDAFKFIFVLTGMLFMMGILFSIPIIDVAILFVLTSLGLTAWLTTLPVWNRDEDTNGRAANAKDHGEDTRMADQNLNKIATYLRQIEKLAAAEDCEAIAREAHLALRLCGKSK